MRKTRWVIIAIGLACVGGTVQTPPQQIQPAKQDADVIVRIVGRHETITAHHGMSGPVYSVQRSDGTRPAEKQTLKQLQASHPELSRKVEAMQAGAWAGIDTD